MDVQLKLDQATALEVARYFEIIGKLPAATRMWQGLCLAAPYDRAAREKLGELLFDQLPQEIPLGSVARSRLILQHILQSLPTKRLVRAYFDNLEQLLKSRVKRTEPGQVVLGLGTGRCGSTTLSAAIASIPDALSTHEQPPFVFWEPLEEQVRFHLDRFRMLADYFSVVFDAAHWWLNVADRFLAEFPQGKIVGLHRQTGSCVRSFMHVKGRGRGSDNHWAPPGNPIWTSNWWDPTYPSYPVPMVPNFDPDTAKAVLIERYVTEYNGTLKSLAATFPNRVLLVRTEDLNESASTARLSALLKVPVTIPTTALNVGGIQDSSRGSQDAF